MDIRYSDHSFYPAVIPREGVLPVPPSQRSYHAPLPWASGEIIDYVEIHSGSDQPTFRRQIPYPIHTDRSLQTKGRWIDVWI